MKTINKVLICGLGAIGGFYAAKFTDNGIDLKVLVDEGRYERYKVNPRVINNKTYEFDYILPHNADFKPDLIIISTKSSGLDDAIENIRNFVGENTVILSFLNGITSEKKIIDKYGDKVLYSYLLGHTFFRNGDIISHDGNAKIVFGGVNVKGVNVKGVNIEGGNKVDANDLRVSVVAGFFDRVRVKYEISDNIIKSQWEKFCFNCCVNQISALTGKTFGQLKNSAKCHEIMKNICDEISLISEKENGFKTDYFKTTLEFLELMIPEGKTSMLQDIEAGKKPEFDLFGKTVYELGQKYNIQTPYNKVIADILESL